jgi:3-hydroxyisobutyrate dehydrogenase-like beta-hydroxyacid dehydrogenase
LFGSDAVAGTGYTDATDYTGGVFLSICDNWASGNNLQLLAEASVLLEAYPLDYQALEESITVMVNGYEVTANNWHYDSAT